MQPNAGPATGRPSPQLWRLALGAGLASFLDAATIITVSISLAIWRAQYGLGVWEVGLLTAGLSFSVALGSLLGGWLGDWWGRARVFRLDLVVFLLGLVVILTAGSGAALTVGVIVVGLAAGADIPTSLAVISDASPPEYRGRLIGLTQSLWIAGILSTFALSFAVSGLGFGGTRILVAFLSVVAAVTLGLRVIGRSPGASAGAARVSPPRLGGLRRLARPDALTPVLVTGAFFVFWNTASTTLGTFGTYFLITVTGLSQSQATGLVLVTFPLALVISLVFVALADTVWRDRLFTVAMVLQVAAFGVGAVTGGAVIGGMVALVVLYSMSNVFAGEAMYKVWSQLLLPAEVRASAMGLTYALARATAALFALVVPALIARSPAALLWILTGCVVVSGSVGLRIAWPRPRGFESRPPGRAGHTSRRRRVRPHNG